MNRLRRLVAALLVLGLAVVTGACGSSDDATTGANRPTVVVTTSILGDVVTRLLGDQAEVLTVMPVGADPHAFQASAQQVAQIGDADLLIANGGGFEEGLVDVIEAARDDGVPTLEVITTIETVELGAGSEHHDEGHGDEGHGDDDHGDDDHGDDDHGDGDHGDDDHGHEHDGEDPHFFTDAARMVVAAQAIVEFLATSVEGIDQDALRSEAAAYIGELETLDADVEGILDAIPAPRRVLVTNHGVFGYFAERYGFEVVGVVVPGGTTVGSVSAGDLAELAEVIEAEGVPAVFADTSSSDELARTLAAEVGDVAVVELYSESLGPAGSDGATYVQMMRTNAERIAGALAG